MAPILWVALLGAEAALACTADADGDGTCDEADRCPTVADELGAWPDACVAGDVEVGAGATLGAGAEVHGPGLIAPKAAVGDGSTLGADATVGRRAFVGEGVSLGVGASLARTAVVEDRVQAGATLTVGYGARVLADTVLGARVSVGNLATLGATLVGDDVRVGRSAVVAGAASLGDDVVVGPGARVEAGATVGAGSVVRRDARVGGGAVLGQGVSVGRGVEIGAGAIIGNSAVLRAGARVEAGASVTSGAIVGRGVVVSRTTPVTDHIELEVDPSTGEVTVLGTPADLVASGSATVDAVAGTATVQVTLVSLSTAILPMPKLVVRAVGAGTLAAEDGLVDGLPYLRLGLPSLGPASVRAAAVDLSGLTEGSPLTLSLDLRSDPAILSGTWNEQANGTDMPMIDVGTGTIAGFFLFPTLVGPNDWSRVRPSSFTPDGRYLFLGSSNLGAVARLDMTTTASLLTTMVSEAQYAYVEAAVYNPVDQHVYAVLHEGSHAAGWYGYRYGPLADVAEEQWSNQLVKLDADLNEVARISLSQVAQWEMAKFPALSPDGTLLAIGGKDRLGSVFHNDEDPAGLAGNLKLIDLTTFTEIDTDPAQPGVQPVDLSGVESPGRVAFAPDGASVWVGCDKAYEDGQVTRIDVATRAVTSIQAFSSPVSRACGFAFTPDSDVIAIPYSQYATWDYNNTAIVPVRIDRDTLAVTAISGPATRASAIAVSADGLRAYARNMDIGQSIHVIDLSTATIVDTFTFGDNELASWSDQLIVTP